MVKNINVKAQTVQNNPGYYGFGSSTLLPSGHISTTYTPEEERKAKQSNAPYKTLWDIFVIKADPPSQELETVKLKYLAMIKELMSNVLKLGEEAASKKIKSALEQIYFTEDKRGFYADTAAKIANSDYMISQARTAFANISSEYGKFNPEESETYGQSWTANQWTNVLLALRNRAIKQYKSLSEQALAAKFSDDPKSKALNFRKTMKQAYIGRIENLMTQLETIKQTNKISGDSPIQDQLLAKQRTIVEKNVGKGGGIGGATTGGGGRGRGRGGDEYGGNVGDEGEAQQANNRRLQLKPFTSQANGDLPIKQLLRAYNLDNDSLFRSVMDEQAPDVLIAKDWLSLNYYPVSKHLIALVAEGTEASEYMARLYYAIVAINKAYKQATTQYGGEPDKKETDTIAKWLNAINIYRTDKHGVGRGRSYIEDEAKQRRNLEQGNYNAETSAETAQPATNESLRAKWKDKYQSDVKYWDKVMERNGFKNSQSGWYTNQAYPDIYVNALDGGIYKRNTSTNQLEDTGKNILNPRA